MLAVGYFVILPSVIKSSGAYESLPTSNDEDNTVAEPQHSGLEGSRSILADLRRTTRRIQPLVIPYMAPLFLVYVSEYTINQVSPVKLLLIVGSKSYPPISARRHALQSYP